MVGIPLKLLDAGTELTSPESVVLRSSKQARALRVIYDPKKITIIQPRKNGFIFDENNAEFLGSLVFKPPNYAFIEKINP